MSDEEFVEITAARQAIAFAIDCNSIVLVTASGLAQTFDRLITPKQEKYSKPDSKYGFYFKYDVNAAKVKLIEAVYPNGFSINCMYRSTDSVMVSFAEMLQNMLEKVGVTLDLIVQESAVLYVDLRAGEYDTFIVSGGQINPRRMIQLIDSRVDYSTCTGGAGFV